MSEKKTTSEGASRERRKHKRFSATAFLNRPVHLRPLPPLFSEDLKGRLIDLSAGGMAIVINQSLPVDSMLDLNLRFPDGSELNALVQVRHVMVRDPKHILHGIEFVAVDPDMATRIDRMSGDYINCESRIIAGTNPICRAECAFFTMCTKKEKLEPVPEVEKSIEVSFRPVGKPAPQTP